MATAPEAAMMDMPQEAAPNPFSDPNTMDVYDQMRQSVSPKEFGDELLAGASQTAPEDVAAFRSALEQIEMPPEALDLLNNMVDEILANPEKYDEIRAKYKAMDAPDEILPEQFDPQFFAALNMAVDQMIAEPAGAQAFARGGIAELTPISKAIANYGRNGDTMLAHITPAEARMLRRRGGSGTINPKTGLPEFFNLFKSIGKAFKAVGNAVKSFANSTIGKIVLPIALGFFLGPAAAAFIGVGATSVAGVAIAGFVGGAGSTLLGGGNLKDALKAGAIGGLTAGAVAGVSGASLTGTPSGLTPGQALSGQVDRFTNFVNPSATASGIQAPAIDASGNVKGLTTIPEQTINPLDRQYATPAEIARVENMNPAYASDETLARQQSLGASPENQFTAKKVSVIPDGQGGVQAPPNTEVRPFTDASGKATSMGTFPTNSPVGAPYYDVQQFESGLPKPPAAPSFMDQAKDIYKNNFSPSGIQAQGATDALSKVEAQFPGVTRDQILNAPANSALGKAYAAAMPGIVSTYGPLAAAGIGALALGGGFKPRDAAESTLRPELMKPVTQRIAEGGNQRNYYMQGLPGVKYDQYGAPIFGQYKPLPTFDTGLGIESLINPRGFAAGGAADKVFNINNFDQTAYLNAHPDVKEAIARGEIANAYEHYTKFGKAEGRTAFDKAETEAKAATDRTATEAAQAANRKLVADATAAKKAAGFGNAYQNINAGLSYDVPAGIAATAIAARQAAFKPTMDKFTQAQAANAATLAKPYTPTIVDQPYNNTKGYTNVLNPVAPKINYDTTPELTAAQKAAADAAAKAAAEKAAAEKAAAEKAAAGMTAAQKAAAEKAAADKLAADKLAAEKAAAEAAARAAAAKAAADRTLFQGQSAATQNQQIMDYLKANPNATDRTLAQQMDYYGIKPSQVAQVTGMESQMGNMQGIDRRYNMAKDALQGSNPFAVAQQNAFDSVTGQNIRDYFAKNPGMTDQQTALYMDQNAIDPRQMEAAFAGTPGAVSAPDIFARYQEARKPPLDANTSFSNAARNLTADRAAAEQQQIQNVNNSFSNAAKNLVADRTAAEQQQIQNVNNSFSNAARNLVADRGVAPPVQLTSPGGFSQDRMALDNQVTNQNAQGLNATPEQLAEMRRLSELSENSPEVNAQRDALNEEARRRGTFSTQGQQLFNMGGIASLGSGGYPRRTGQINGPGTATSDSIPAMLSDGEFVMTARAVRGAGKGDKRAGAKRMYALMNQLEKNAARG